MLHPPNPCRPLTPLGDDAQRSRRAVRCSHTAGFTLVELLVAMTLALVVFTAVTALLIDGVGDQSKVEGRAFQLQQSETAMSQLVRNLREATSVTLPNASSISYSIPVSTGIESITFACSTVTATCTQTIAGVHQTVITGIANSNIFTATPTSNPTYIGITLTLSANGQTPVTVTDGTGLRNVTLGS